MTNTNLNLGYNIDNIAAAEALAERLSQAGFHVHHLYGKADQPGGNLANQLLESPHPIILLISDNFLKSVSCMSGSLQLLQRKKEDILPVIIDGVNRDNPEQSYHTRFERVSDIIQYINYWQEQYLDLRRQKRQLDLEHEESFHNYLREVRSISGEAGEFLRLLRHMNFYRLEELAENNYEALYRFLGMEKEWENAPQIQAPSIQEQASGRPESFPASDIPGIDLLEEREKAGHDQDSAAPESVDTPAKEAPTGPSPEERRAQIDQLIAGGRQGEALEQIDEGLAENPHAIDLHYTKGRLLADMGRTAEATAALSDLLQAKPGHVEGRFLRAELEESRKEYHRARQDLEQVLEHDPDHPTASFRLGTLLTHHFTDEPLEAARVLKSAIQKDNRNADAFHQYAILLKNQLQQPEMALGQLERTLTLDPDNARARLDLGEVYLQLDRRVEAAEAYQLATEMEPSLKTAERDDRFRIPEKPAAEEPVTDTRNQPESPIFSVDDPSPQYDWGESAEQQDEPAETEETPEPQQQPNFSNGLSTRQELTAEMVDEEMDTPDLPEEADESPAAPAVPEPPEAREEDLLAPQPEEDNTINALKDNLKKLELLLAERRRREQEALEAMKVSKTDAQTVLITGASSGIGKATAEKFAENGYRVIITGRRSDRLMALKEQFEEEFEDAEIYPLPFDVRDLGSIQLALNRLPDEWKEVDILINNAGKAKGLDPIHQGNIEHWNEMIDTNLKGLLYLTRAISPGMVDRRKGHIINIGSTAGKEVYPKGGVYCATKFAVDALTKAMRLDFHRFGIRVSQVSPGHVEETEFALVRFDGDADKARIYEDFQPLKASDVAEAIFFLATQPKHVNIQDVVMMGTQQASATMIDRSGRKYDGEG